MKSINNKKDYSYYNILKIVLTVNNIYNIYIIMPFTSLDLIKKHKHMVYAQYIIFQQKL